MTDEVSGYIDEEAAREAQSLFFMPDAAPPQEFFGRQRELAQLTGWLSESVKVSIIHGFGGTGKTELVRQALNNVRHGQVIWCSLRDSPSVATLLRAIFTRYPNQADRTGGDPVERLVSLLRSGRFVLVLDNLEAVLDDDPASNSGLRRDYSSLLSSLARADHPSKIIVTTRVLPPAEEAVRSSTTRIQKLAGIGARSAISLLRRYDLHGSSADRAELIRRYDANPLALQLAAELIADLYGGQISRFLQSEVSVLGDVRQLIEAHFVAVPRQQRSLLVRLATAREPLTFDALVAGTILDENRSLTASSVQVLLRRSLIERRGDRFFLQYLIQEYVLGIYVHAIIQGISSADAQYVGGFPMVDTERPVHIRDAQRRLTVEMVTRALLRSVGGHDPALTQLRAVLDHARRGQAAYGSFAAANAVGVCRSLGEPLSEFDLTSMFMRNIDYSDFILHDVKMDNCEFEKCRFATANEHTFGLAVSSDGSFAALGQVGGAIVLVEVPTGRVIRSFEWDAVWLRAVALSTDDQLLAATDDRGRIRVVQLSTGQAIDIPGNGRQIRSLAFSTDGRLLFAGGEEGIVRRIDPLRGSDPQVVAEAGSEVWGLACDARTLAVATSGDGLKLLELPDISEVPIERVVGVSGRSVALSRYNDPVYVGCDDGSVRVWARTGGALAEIPGHKGSVWATTIGKVRDSEVLFSGSQDGSIRVVEVTDLSRPHLRGILLNDEGPVWPIALDDSSHVLATVSGSSIVRFWDPHTLQPIERLRGGLRRTFVVASNDDTTLIATAGQDGVVRLWNSSVDNCLFELSGHRGGIRQLAFSSSGRLLASGGEDWEVRIWDVVGGNLIKVLEGPANWVWCLDFSPSGEQLAAGSSDLRIHIWELRGNFASRRLEGHSARVVGVAYTEDGTHIISCGIDGECWTWDTESWAGHLRLVLPDGASCMTYLGGMRVAVGDRRGRLTMIDLADRDPHLIQRQISENQVLSLRSSPTSSACFIGTEQGEVARLALETGEITYTVLDGQDPIRSICWISRGAELLLATGTETLPVVAEESLSFVRKSVVPRQYEGLRLRNSRGLTTGELETLKNLGAIEEFSPADSDAPVWVSNPQPATDAVSLGNRVSVFISYSQADSIHMEELKKHLAVLEVTGAAQIWVDRPVSGRTDWDSEIDSRIQVADIVLLLLSADYLSSAYCRSEMDLAIRRGQESSATVVPIVLRYCDWQSLPVSAFHALPHDGRPIVGSSNLDEVRSSVTTALRGIVDDLLINRDSTA